MFMSSPQCSMQVMTHLEAPLSRLLREDACAVGCRCEARDLELTLTSPSDSAVARECARDTWPEAFWSTEPPRRLYTEVKQFVHLASKPQQLCKVKDQDVAQQEP